jgi:hypothetical protein
VESVPQKYHAHIGKHEAHPGTGKGRVALKRLQGSELAVVE